MKIYTLDAANCFLLPVTSDYLGLTDKQCAKVIINSLVELKRILKQKGVEYEDLKASLIPVHSFKDGQEIAFIFDASLINARDYGNVIFDALIPALNKESKYSILCGDIITTKLPPVEAKKILFENLNLIHKSCYKSPAQYFVVYFNKLTKAQLATIVEALSSLKFFTGYVDVSFSSPLKTILSLSLGNLGIKYKNKIILSHESDRDDFENVNLRGYGFEENGFTVISINETLFNLFLSYKIVSMFPDADDLKYSLLAISKEYLPVLDLPVKVPEGKLSYIKKDKSHAIKYLNSGNITEKELEYWITNSIKRSYLYNLEYVEEHDTIKFNIIAEQNNKQSVMCKVLVALKYIKETKKLQIVSMY